MPNPNTFQKSLKPLAIEEFLDYYFYRRVAHLLVPILWRLKLTPNQVSTLSMLSGVTAAYFVYHQHFIAGALLAIFAIFLDCSDGQLARLSGKTSSLGRIYDGVMDMTWITAFWAAILFSNYLQDSGFHQIFWLMLPSSVSVFLHCWRFDGVKIQYLELAEPDFSEKDLDCYEAAHLMKAEFKKGHLLTAFLAFCMVFQMYLFVRGTKKKKVRNFSEEEIAIIRNKLSPLINQWTWLGESHHSTPVIVGVLLAPWNPYPLYLSFALILIPMNIWFFYCEWRWRGVLRELQDVIPL